VFVSKKGYGAQGGCGGLMTLLTGSGILFASNCSDQRGVPQNKKSVQLSIILIGLVGCLIKRPYLNSSA
jgi:hypothetical protein